MFFLIGLDDTCAEGSQHCTGTLAMMLGERLEARVGCRVVSVTRHQLLRSAQLLPDATHNMAACLRVDADTLARLEIELYCREFLLRWSDPGINAGFALAQWNYINPGVIAWGHLAKRSYLVRRDAAEVARLSDVTLVAMRGTGAGVIGALAAVALLYSGDDGRFTWLPGLRGLKGIYTSAELNEQCPFDRVENLYGRAPYPRDKINVGDRPRPLLKNGRSLLLLDAMPRGDECLWKTLDPDRVDELAA